MIRICAKCKGAKPLDDFPNNCIKKLGKGYTCKSCCNAYDSFRRKTQPKRNNLSRQWMQSDKGKLYSKVYNAQHDLENKVRRQVEYLINEGLIIRQPCEICGKKDAYAHHDNYDEPFNLRWLCPTHHKKYHLTLSPALS